MVLVRATTSPAVNAPDYVPPLKVLLCREEVDVKNNARTDKLMKNGAGRARMFGRVKPAELVSYSHDPG